jgi:hypothetical protein
MALQHSPSIVTSGLVLCLDAASPRSYPGSGTNWVDVTGNGNTGTLTNGPTYNSSNLGSITFDGIDDRVEMTGKGLAFSNFSIEAMIKPSSNNGGYEAIISTTLGTNNDYEYGLNWDLGPDSTASFNVMNLEISRAYGGFFNRDVMISSFPFNTWVHLFLTVSASSAFYKVYVNGVEDYSGTYSGTTTNFDRIVIGQRYYGGSYQGSSTFTGNIAGVKIYDRSLSAAEVLQNFNALRGRYGI